MSIPVNERRACRAVLLTPDREILLMQVQEGSTGWTGWITPGGGREPGETTDDTLGRELFEETGATGFGIGPQIWTRDHSFTWEGRPSRQLESYFLIRTPRFTPTTEHQPEPVEIRAFRRFCWWPLEAIEASEDTFVPARLAPLIRDLLEYGPPAEPFDAGI